MSAPAAMDWVQPLKIPLCVTQKKEGPDHTGAGTRVIVTVNMDKTMYVPVQLMGPLANKSSLSIWAQYLRRMTTYLCVNFLPGNFGNALANDSHQWGDYEWLRLYNVTKHSDL